MAWRGGLALCAISLVAALLYSACARPLVQPSDTVQIPRAVVVQARGKILGIYGRVRALEAEACKAGRLTKAQCQASAGMDAAFKRSERELEAILAEPHYQVDWKGLLEMLDQIGSIVDALP